MFTFITVFDLNGIDSTTYDNAPVIMCCADLLLMGIVSLQWVELFEYVGHQVLLTPPYQSFEVCAGQM